MKRLIIIIALFYSYKIIHSYDYRYPVTIREAAEKAHVTLCYAPELSSDKEFYSLVFGPPTIRHIHWQLIWLKKEFDSIDNNDIIPNINEWILIGLGYDHLGHIELASIMTDLCWIILDHFHKTDRVFEPCYAVPPHPGNGISSYPYFETIAYMIAIILRELGWVTDIYLDPQIQTNNPLDLLVAKINAMDYALLIRKKAIDFKESSEKIALVPEEYLRRKLLIAADNFFNNAMLHATSIIKKAQEKSLSCNETLEFMPNQVIIANRVADYFMLWMKNDKDTVI